MLLFWISHIRKDGFVSLYVLVLLYLKGNTHSHIIQPWEFVSNLGNVKMSYLFFLSNDISLIQMLYFKILAKYWSVHSSLQIH